MAPELMLKLRTTTTRPWGTSTLSSRCRWYRRRQSPAIRGFLWGTAFDSAGRGTKPRTSEGQRRQPDEGKPQEDSQAVSFQGDSAFAILRPLAAGGVGEVLVARVVRPESGSRREADPRSPGRRPAEPSSIPARSGDHGRPRAPIDRADLCVGDEPGWAALLRDAFDSRRNA